jgi:hypothetical protein
MYRHTRCGPIAFSIALAIAIIASLGIHAAAAQSSASSFKLRYLPREAAGQGAAVQRGSIALGPLDPGRLPMAQTLFFSQTGHHLSNRAGFLDFWRANGQVLLFGYPITEEIIEDGRIVQYFERTRLEYHPARAGGEAQVRIGLLGSELTAGRFVAVPDPQNGARYFPETGHSLGGEFRAYWERRGGLAIFGYPISEELNEDGLVVQYFERARFEYNPNDMGAFYRSMEAFNGIQLHTLHEVVVSDLGRRAAAARGIRMASVTQLVGTRVWSPALWARRIEVSLTQQWLTAYEDSLAVYRAPVATGRDGFNTPTGSFAIYMKLPVQTMTGDASGESWYVPDVPWVQYVVGGVALHGTYWHDKFGTGFRLSHGCINLGMDDAEWLYSWADIGTPVAIGN